MFSYEFYKVMHFAMIFLFFGSVGASFLGSDKSKHLKILTGISSFLILVGGMGLLARIGVSHKEGWPVWAYAKLGIWLLLAALTPILSKRVKKSFSVFYVFVALGVMAGYIAVNKPF